MNPCCSLRSCEIMPDLSGLTTIKYSGTVHEWLKLDDRRCVNSLTMQDDVLWLMAERSARSRLTCRCCDRDFPASAPCAISGVHRDRQKRNLIRFRLHSRLVFPDALRTALPENVFTDACSARIHHSISPDRTGISLESRRVRTARSRRLMACLAKSGSAEAQALIASRRIVCCR